MENVTFNICCLSQSTVDDFTKVFADKPNFNVMRRNILQITKSDCIVSPGNSYGMMDGGVDRPINYALDYISERKIKPIIKQHFGGEQPVGTCVLVGTGNHNYPWLAHCPTMRCPRNIQGRDNAYVAFRALLNSLKRKREITTVLMTPFCTGAGEMRGTVSAKQMKLAYDMLDNDINWKTVRTINEKIDSFELE